MADGSAPVYAWRALFRDHFELGERFEIRDAPDGARVAALRSSWKAP